MYNHIIGKLAVKKPTEAVIDVGGIGYLIRIPLSSYDKLPPIKETARLFTHLHVREDQLTLFGFATEDERTLFQMLINVSGVGPVVALSILSGMYPPEIVRCVRDNDVDSLKRVKGIGPKTAQRIILELQGKVDALQITVTVGEHKFDPAATDAVLALISLGVQRRDAELAVIKALKSCEGKTPPSDELVKLALQHT